VTTIVPGVGPVLDREPYAGPRNPSRHGLDGDIIGVGDPVRGDVCVSEQQSLVAVVFVERRVSVEMIRGQVGEDAHVGLQVRRIVQLK
jgi:hypothetical protein